MNEIVIAETVKMEQLEKAVQQKKIALKKPKKQDPYFKVTDARGHGIKNLWVRNGRFYVQLRLPGKKSQSKLALRDSHGAPVETVAQAKEAMDQILLSRRQRKPIVSTSVKLKEWIDKYLAYVEATGLRRAITLKRETASLRLWQECVGHVRLTEFGSQHLTEFYVWRKEGGNSRGREVGNNTLNLDTAFLNNVFHYAIQEKHLHHLPTAHRKPLPFKSPPPTLWSPEQIQHLCATAKRVLPHHGLLLADYILFMAYSGSRRTGAFQLKWECVDWNLRQVRILSKGEKTSVVDFNHQLEAHLKDMFARRAPDSEYLFPYNQETAEPTGHMMSYFLKVARRAAGMPTFHFHELRHFFISSMVMSGIDFMTIAKWVSHSDGGVLIGKVYGHLNNEHMKRQADKAFGGKKIEENTLVTMLQQMQAQLAALQAK